MFTVSFLFAALAATAQAGTPANTLCSCQIRGDPHLTDFMGRKDDYGGGWTNMVKSADCFLNVQTYSKGPKKANDKVAVRMGNSWALIDHKKMEVQGTNRLPQDEMTVTPGNDEITIDGPGVRVVVMAHKRTVDVHYTDADRAARSGGYCGACNRPEYDVCGVDTETDWRVPADKVIWDQAQGDGSTQASSCVAYACSTVGVTEPQADVTAPVTPVTPPYPDSPEEVVANDYVPVPALAPAAKCTPRLRRRKLQELKAIDLNTCDAAATDCKNVGHDFWLKAVAHCRPQVETNWWQMDCNCLRDLCVLKDFNDGADSAKERPCEEPKENQDHIVSHEDGFDYATLDFAAPNGPSGQCHWSQDFQPLAKVPSGWEIAPGNNQNVKDLLKSNSFGAECIMAADDFAYPVGGNTDCTGFSLGRKHLDYHMCYTVTECPSRVLIRRKTATKCTSTVAFEIQGRKVPISDVEGSVQDHLNLMKEKEGTNYALVRSAQQVHLCVATKTALTSTIETTPAYGVSWIGQEDAMVPAGGSDIFLPLIHGNKMHSVQKSAGGFCIGPLDINPNMCLDIAVSKPITFGSETFSSSHFKACPVCAAA